jgi:hypothetical protein
LALRCSKRRIRHNPNNLGQPVGPSGTQKLTSTIGTGTSDRLANVGAIFNERTGTLTVGAFDVNVSALYAAFPLRPGPGPEREGVTAERRPAAESGRS